MAQIMVNLKMKYFKKRLNPAKKFPIVRSDCLQILVLAHPALSRRCYKEVGEDRDVQTRHKVCSRSSNVYPEKSGLVINLSPAGEVFLIWLDFPFPGPASWLGSRGKRKECENQGSGPKEEKKGSLQGVNGEKTSPALAQSAGDGE